MKATSAGPHGKVVKDSTVMRTKRALVNAAAVSAEQGGPAVIQPVELQGKAVTFGPRMCCLHERVLYEPIDDGSVQVWCMTTNKCNYTARAVAEPGHPLVLTQ